jgi:hypothetical protein
MSLHHIENRPAESIGLRASELFAAYQQEIHKQTDRFSPA